MRKPFQRYLENITDSGNTVLDEDQETSKSRGFALVTLKAQQMLRMQLGTRMESPQMEKPSTWNKPPNHHLKVEDKDHLHLRAAEALPEVLEEEVEAQGPSLTGGHMEDGGYPMNFNINSSRGPCQ